MPIESLNESIERKMDILRAIKSPGIQDYAKSVIERIYPEFFDHPGNRVTFDATGFTFYVQDPAAPDLWTFPPEFLSCNTNSLHFWYYKTFYCPDYNNARVDIAITAYQDLDEGDLETLELLGHVREEYVEARIDRTVYCDSGLNDLPF